MDLAMKSAGSSASVTDAAVGRDTTDPLPADTVGRGAASSASSALDRFSFFVTSYAAMQRLSGSVDGFGGDLRYGESDGLSGADKICREIAETAMPGAGQKGWRAFLSVTSGPDGSPVHAIDRVGDGPWYDRLGRLVAMTKADLMTPRPTGADPAIVNDLPNEDGVPNMRPDGTEVDNHDTLTGANETGQLYSSDWAYTCRDWTSSVGGDGTPQCGHSWPRNFSDFFGSAGSDAVPPEGGSDAPLFPGFGDPANWMSALTEAGCAPGATIVELGPPNPFNPTVGSGGGYGGIYCFALTP